jgi:predicted DNA-binding antitoxin AbrB/MazE fold protein
MTQIVTAVYENGILRPLQPLPLTEQQTVRLQLLPDDDSQDEAEEILQLLAQSGLISVRQLASSLPPDPVSPAERHRLAQAAGQSSDKPLSEVIIEERGEW